MEHDINDDPFESFSSRDEKVETLDFLEESWFFENLLNRKTRMSRCNSDPRPSSIFGQEMLVKNLDNDFVRPNLVRTPSFPPCLGREEGITQEKDSNNHTMTKREGIEEKGSHGQAMRPNLLRTQSLPLPLSIVREEIAREKESDPRMSKSTGQASLNLQRQKVL
ncbi:Serine/arginine repetitive matrix protein 2, putative [Fagus crenata]